MFYTLQSSKNNKQYSMGRENTLPTMHGNSPHPDFLNCTSSNGSLKLLFSLGILICVVVVAWGFPDSGSRWTLVRVTIEVSAFKVGERK